MNPVAALLFAVTIINLFLSSLIFFRNIKSPIHTTLAAFIFLAGSWIFSMAMFYQVAGFQQSLLWIKFTYIAAILIANTLVFFALIFPENPKIPLLQKIFVFLPAVPMILAIYFVPNFLFKEIIHNGLWKDVSLGTSEYILYTIYIILIYYGALFIVWKKYQLYRGSTRMQLLYLLSGILIAVSFGVIFDIALPWINLYQFIWLGPIGTLIMIGLFIYATAEHKLMDLRFVVIRTVVYTLIIAFTGALYAGLFFLISSAIIPPGRRYQVISSIAVTLVLMYTFQPLRNYLSKITEKIFYKDKYDSNTLLLKITRILASTLHLNQLVNKTITELLAAINTSTGVIMIFQKNGVPVIFSIGFQQQPTFKLSDAHYLYNQNKVVLLDEQTSGPVQELMRQLDISVSVPLSVGAEPIGVLMLSGKASGDIYSDQDKEVLEILGPEIAVAIQNAIAYEEISRFNITLRDEIEKATRELKFANEKLKELDRLKDEFVSVASHELRTPMTAIKSYLWMVLQKHKDSIPDKQKFYLDRAYNSTERLIKLVNDMLNVSRIESGRITLDKKVQDMRKIAEDIIMEVKPRADELKLTTYVEPYEGLPNVLADEDKIKEVLMNLVGNALKFTPEGGTIKIEFSVKDNMVATKVIDTGKGIAKEDLSKLFKKFSMLEGSYTTKSKAQGTGLGLYISRQIISLHGGQIWVTSEVGKGTTFTFTLPVATEKEQTIAMQEAVVGQYQQVSQQNGNQQPQPQQPITTANVN